MVYTQFRRRDAIEGVMTAFNYTKKQFGAKIRYMQMDGESALIEKQFYEFVSNEGIQIEKSPSDTHEPNGHAERLGHELTTKARSLIIHARLPTSLFPEAYKTAGYLLNRTPLKKLGWITPYEEVHSHRPSIAHLQPFGCKSFALNKNIPKLQNMDPKAMIGYLTGYESTNIFRIWTPSKRNIIPMRDVWFKPDEFYDSTSLDVGSMIREHSDNILEVLSYPASRNEELDDQSLYETQTQLGLLNTENVKNNASTGNDYQVDNVDTNIQMIEPQSAEIQPSKDVPINQLPTPFLSPEVDNVSTQSSSSLVPTSKYEIVPRKAPRGFIGDRNVDVSNIIQGCRKRKANSRYAAHVAKLGQNGLSNFFSAYALGFISDSKKPHRDDLPPPPKYWHHINNHKYSKEFYAAALLEIKALLSKGTFEYIDLPFGETKSDETLLLLMWLFSYKFGEDGYLAKYKARLVARDDLHKTTNEEMYAATLAAQTFRIFMAVVAYFDLETQQFDGVNAFANASLPEPMLVRTQAGYSQNPVQDAGVSNLKKALRLYKALYGLPMSPLLWYGHLTDILSEMGLLPVPGTNCLFTDCKIWVTFCVDDIVISYRWRDQSKAKEFESKFRNTYKIRNLGEISHFLGLRVIRKREQKKIWILQDSYIDKITDKFNVDISHYPSIPIPVEGLGKNIGSPTSEQILAYQKKVGSINWLSSNNRPDLAKSASILAEHLTSPGPIHQAAVTQALRYVAGTKYLALRFSGQDIEQAELMPASDASFADDPTRRSPYGFCFILFGGPIVWKATRGRTVTTSSTEAELLALSIAAKEYIALMRLFEHIHLKFEIDTSICCENKQTIRLLEKEAPKLQTALRHVDINQCWLRQEVQEGRIKIKWVST